MSSAHDLIVIGTGKAATTVGRRARASGSSVTVVDFRPFGGTCALRGCDYDPKKMMIGGAGAFTLAVRHDLTADQLSDAMFAHPSGASDISSML